MFDNVNLSFKKKGNTRIINCRLRNICKCLQNLQVALPVGPRTGLSTDRFVALVTLVIQSTMIHQVTRVNLISNQTIQLKRLVNHLNSFILFFTA